MTYYANKCIAKAKILFMKPYWEHFMKRVQMKIFTFYRDVPHYNRVSVTTNIKNSSLLIKIQDGDEENSTEWRELRAILWLY